MSRPLGFWPPWDVADDLPDEFLAENQDLQRPRSREELGLWRDWTRIR